MSFLLVIFLLPVSNGALSDILRRNLNETFDINIGAGYGVGLEQSSLSSSLPKSTTTVNHNTNHLSKILSDEIFKNETYIKKNLSPRYTATQTPNHQLYLRHPKETTPAYENHKYDIKNLTSSTVNQKERYNELDSAYSASNQQQHFHIPSSLNVESSMIRPNIQELQTMINNLEGDSKYSKVVQVLKVPAIYEIHLQSNVRKKKIDRSPPRKILLETKPISNTNANYDDYIKWLNDYYSKRENTFHVNENHKPVDNFNDYSLGNLLHFGKTDLHPTVQELKTFPVSTELKYQGSSAFPQIQTPGKSEKLKSPPTFRKHKETANMQQQLQAIYEVPAPYLGNSVKHEPFDKTKTTAIFKKPNYLKPTQSLPQGSVNVYSTLTPNIPYGYRINKKLYNQNLSFNNHNQPVINSNQNLVYGKAFERVLSPHSGSTHHRRISHTFNNNMNMLHPTEIPRVINVTIKPEDVYFTTEKCSIFKSGRGLPPADNVKKRKSKHMYNTNRRNLDKTNKVPDLYVVITRIHESVDNSGGKK